MFPIPSWNYLTWNIQVKWANFDEGYFLGADSQVLDINTDQVVAQIVRYVELSDDFNRPEISGYSAEALVNNWPNQKRSDMIGQAFKAGWIQYFYSFKIDGSPISAEQAARLKLSSADSDLFSSSGLITLKQFQEAFGMLNGQDSANLFNEEELDWVFNKLYLHVRLSDENRFWMEEKFIGSAVSQTLEFDTINSRPRIIFLKPEKISEKFRLTGHTADIKVESDWKPNSIAGLSYQLRLGLSLPRQDGKSFLTEAQMKAMNIKNTPELLNRLTNKGLSEHFSLKDGEMQANLWVSQDRKWGFDQVYGGTGGLRWYFYIDQAGVIEGLDGGKVLASFFDSYSKTDYKISITSQTPIPTETIEAFTKYVQVNDLVDKLKQIEADTSEASTNEQVRWHREADFINPLFDDFRARGVRLDFSDAKVGPSYGFDAQGWNYNYKLPTKLDRDPSARFLWAQVVWGEKTGNYIISWPKVIDLTESSKIRLVKTFLDVSEVDLSAIIFKGDIRKPSIDYNVLSDDLQPYVSILFQGEGIFGNKWMTYDELLSAFTDELSKGPNYSLHRVFRAKVAAKEGVQVVFKGTDQVQNVNTDQFYSYRNITSLLDALKNSSGSNKVDVFGSLGVDNGIAIRLPTTLKQDQLSLWKTTLQVSVDNQQNWIDIFPQLDQAIDPNQDLGIPAIPAGLGAIFTVKQIGGQTASLAFRFVPYADENGQTPEINSPNDYQAIVEATKVHNSDFFDSNFQKPEVYVITLDNLPTVVVTIRPTSGQVEIAGRTNDNFQANVVGNHSDWQTWLQDLNQGSDYTAYVKATLHVAIAGDRLALEMQDFVKWINGQLKANSSGQVVDQDGQAVKRWKATAADPDSFVYGDLTAQEATPDWNKMLGPENVFIFTWLSTDLVNYRPSESRGTEIDMANVVRYIDASVLEARFAPTGNTHKWSGWSEDSAAVLDQIIWGYRFDNQPTPISEAQMNALGLSDAQKETVRGKTQLTQAELLKLFDGSTPANIWDQRRWEFAVNLYSIAKVKDPEHFWTKSSHQKHDLYQASAPSKNWKRFFDVSLLALDKAYLTGHSHIFGKLENIAYADGTQLPVLAKKDLAFKLTLNAGSVISDQQQNHMNLSAKPLAWMTFEQLKDFWQSNGVSARGGANLWYRDANKWATQFFGIGVDLTTSPSSYQLSERLSPVTLNLEAMSTLKKYIWVQDYRESLEKNVKAVVERYKSDSDQVLWQDIGFLVDQLKKAGLKVEFSTASSPSFDNADDWQFLNQLPKQVAFNHQDRYLYAKVTPEDYPNDRYVLSNQGKSWDLTASSNLQKVLARINVDNVDLTQVVFTQNTFDAVIDARAWNYLISPL
ncbi:hypothetical protein [Mycoplasma sp. ATU-Cv-508]|uniref:hypothetical protein n=1 Tax=Mycoplasma sp. ATU-Cv-508 TaxID=2048001 RepID=UPI000FDD13CD